MEKTTERLQHAIENFPTFESLPAVREELECRRRDEDREFLLRKSLDLVTTTNPDVKSYADCFESIRYAQFKCPFHADWLISVLREKGFNGTTSYKDDYGDTVVVIEVNRPKKSQ